MKAVRMHEYGGPEVLRHEEHVPEPALPDDAVLVEAWATSVNPIDWKVRSGARQKDFPLQLPAILGRDVSGVVRAVGRNVRTFKPGDRVLAMTVAAYAELVAVEEAALTHLPDGVDMVDAAALPLVALTGDQLVRHCAPVQRGQTIIVSGALGGVGRSAVHAAKKVGARVIAGARATQLAEAKALGVDGVLAIDDELAVAAHPHVDAVADTVGGDTATRLLRRVKDGGRFGYASVLPEGAALLRPAVTITRVYAKPDPSKVREFADDVRDGTFTLPVSHRLPLRDAAEAHRMGQAGGAGKIVLLCRA